MMVNLDPKREDARKDIDLVHLTRKMIRTLEEKLGRSLPFAAVIHNADHSPLRHMHGLFLLQGGRLTRQQFVALRLIATSTATEEARRQRRLRDLVRENPRVRFLTQAYVRTRPQEKIRGVKPLQLQHGCTHCGYGQMMGIPKWRTYCPSCRKPLNRARPLQLTREVSA
jgi:hypothetical protein